MTLADLAEHPTPHRSRGAALATVLANPDELDALWRDLSNDPEAGHSLRHRDPANLDSFFGYGDGDPEPLANHIVPIAA